MLDIIKMLVPFLGGSLVGGLFVEWLRRRAARIQIIPLIIRMNRLVRAEIAGFTLARVTGPESPPEVISDLREYQFTLKNTSNVHLQDAEIQFEFPATEVQGLAERPVRSNTTLLPVSCDAQPDKSIYRWRIPQFPATDSIDFTFRAINATSDKFEVAFYKSDRVVVKAFTGEPSSGDFWIRAVGPVMQALLLVCLAGVAFTLGSSMFASLTDRYTEAVTQGGCVLKITSSMDALHRHTFWPSSGPWEVDYDVENLGPNDCSVYISPSAAVTIPSSSRHSSRMLSSDKPMLVERNARIGSKGNMEDVKVRVYSSLSVN